MTFSTFKSALVASAAVGILMSPAMDQPAQAKKQPYLDFQIVPSQFGKPTMVYSFKDGKYRWDGKTITTTFRLRARSSSKRWLPSLDLVTQSVHGTAKMLGTVPSDRKVIDLTDSITFKKSFLAVYSPNFADYCQRNASSKKLVKDGLTAPFQVSLATDKSHVFRDNVQMPLRVVCNPLPNPGRAPTALKVTKLKLYTIPAKPKCNANVKMVAEIHTNKPGKVEFRYYRGDGEHATGSVITAKGGTGYSKRWSRTYKFGTNTNRKYMVSLIGHKKSTNWVPLKVNCGAVAEDKPGKLESKHKASQTKKKPKIFGKKGLGKKERSRKFIGKKTSGKKLRFNRRLVRRK